MTYFLTVSYNRMKEAGAANCYIKCRENFSCCTSQGKPIVVMSLN